VQRAGDGLHDRLQHRGRQRMDLTGAALQALGSMPILPGCLASRGAGNVRCGLVVAIGDANDPESAAVVLAASSVRRGLIRAYGPRCE
jgi:hypothetical protein